MTKAPTLAGKSKKQSESTQKLRLHNDCRWLRTVSWSNNSHPTGVIKPVYERSTFHRGGGNLPWFWVRKCGWSPRTPSQSYTRLREKHDPFIYFPYRKLTPFIYFLFKFYPFITFWVKKIPNWYTFDVKSIPIHILAVVEINTGPVARGQ